MHTYKYKYMNKLYLGSTDEKNGLLSESGLFYVVVIFSSINYTTNVLIFLFFTTVPTSFPYMQNIFFM